MTRLAYPRLASIRFRDNPGKLRAERSRRWRGRSSPAQI